MKHFFNILLVFMVTLPCYAQVLSNNGAVANILSGTIVTGGNIESNSGTITNSGTINLNDLTIQSGGTLTNNAVLKIAGTIANSGTFNASTGSIELNGTGAQAITSPASFNHLIINKVSGTTTLLGNLTVAGTLTFTSGKITTGSNTLNATGTVSGAGQSTGWVFGNLKKAFSGAALTGTFDVGGSSYYSPLTMSFAGISVAGSVTASSTDGAHPNLSGSTISAVKSIPRYWTVTNSGVAFSTYTLGLSWNAAQNYSGLNAAQLGIGKYTSAAWSLPAVTGTPTITNVQAAGITTMGDFVAGEGHISRYYVNNASTTGDVYTTATGNNTNPGTASAPFLTINYAISVAGAGDTIYVDAGSYPEQVAVGKMLTILGTNAAISPNGGTRNSESMLNNSGNNAISITTTSRVVIKGFRITTSTNTCVGSNTTGSKITLEKNFFDASLGLNFNVPDSLLFTDNRFSGILSGEGVFITGGYNGTTGTHIDINSNTWINSGATGMNVSNAQGSIYNNTFNGVSYYAVLVASYCNLNITRNTFTGTINPDTTVNTYGAGIRIYTPSAGMTVSVTNNYFTGNYIGFAVRAGGNLAGTYVAVNNNYFSGNTFANINHTGTGMLDASCNWYGTTSRATVAATIMGPVQYIHYLSNGTDNDAVTPGFQPVPGSCTSPSVFYVNDAATTGDVYTTATGSDANIGTSSAPFLTINYAISVAGTGDTIYVDAGAYGEQVNANKLITILGANAAISPNTGTRNAESILNNGAGTAITITTTSRVVVKGFRVTAASGSSLNANTSNNKVTLEKMFFDGAKGISLFSSDSLLFIDNKLNNMAAGDAVFIQGNYNGTTGTYLQVYDNTWSNGLFQGMNISGGHGDIYDNTMSAIAYYGILVANYSSLNITRNTFSGIINPDTSVKTYGAAVRTYNPSAGMVTTVTNNYFINCYIGIANRPTDTLTGRYFSVNNNAFSGSTYKNINNTGIGLLNATCNWYGSADTSMISAKISGPVTWVPLLISGTDNDLITGGFQPAPGTCAYPNTWTGNTSTDWNTTSNWSKNALPVSTDYVIIPTSPAGSRMPALASGTATINSLAIQAGATLTHSGGTLNSLLATGITGTYTQSGGVYLSGGTVTVNTGGIINESGTGNFHLDNSVGATATNSLVLAANSSLNQSGGTIQTNDLTINAAGCTYTQTGGLLQINRNYINNGTFNASAGTVEWIGNATAAVFSGTNQFFTVLVDAGMDAGITPGSNISVGGNYTSTTYGVPATATIIFNGTGIQNITGINSAAATFGNLIINKSAGTALLVSNANVAGDITVSSGTFDLSTFTSNRTTGGGAFNILGTSLLRVAGASGGQTGSNIPLNFNAGGSATTSTVEYYGSNAVTQTIFSLAPYGNLILTNGSGSGSAVKNTSATITVYGNLTVNGGTVLIPDPAALISGSGTLTGAGTVQVTRTAATPDFLSQYALSNKILTNLTVEYAATAAQTISAVNYGNLVTSGARTTNSITYAPSGTIGVSGVFIPGATFTSGTNIITGSTIDFNGTTAQGIPAFNYNNLTVSGTRTGNSITYASGGIIGIAGVFNPSATFTSGANIMTGSTLDFNGTGAQNIPAFTFNNLSVTGAGTTKTVTGAVLTGGTLTVNTGATLDMTTYALTGTVSAITGTGTIKTQNATATPIPSGKTWTGTVEYNRLTGGQTIVAGTYGNLTTSNTSNSNTTAGVISVTGTTTLNALSVLNMSGTGTSSVNNLSLQSGASLSAGNAVLQIAGTITGSGKITATTGGIVMNGTAAQIIPASLFAGNAVKDLTTNNSAGVTLNGTLNITGILKATTGSFSTGSYLTLVSSPAQTALIDGSGAGSVAGNVTMQRYLSSGFGYRYISSPFQAATVAQLSNDVNLSAPFPTVYWYDENLASAGWTNYTATTGLLNPLQGYAVNFGPSAPAKTIDITGVVNNGTVNAATLYNRNRTYTLGFNLAGNPYPSPVDWTAAGGWSKTNIDNAIYYFNNGSTDQYLGTYSSFINGVSSDGVASGIIPSMQGFFIHVSNGTYPVTASLSVNNAARVNNLAPVFHKQTGGTENPLLRISAGYEDHPGLSDPAVVYFDNGATPAYDRESDALKMLNTDDRVPSFYSMAANDKLSINAIPEPGDTTSAIPLGLQTDKAGWLVFTARDISHMPPGLHLYFADAQTGIIQDLEQTPTYRQQLDKGSFQNRFYLLFSRQAKVSIPGTEELNAYTKGGSVFVSLTEGRGSLLITNILGQVIRREELAGSGLHEIPLQSAPGIYIISLSTDKGIRAKKIFLGNQ